MRIYATADLHGKRDRERRAIDLASSSDLVIVCGDITHFGPADHAKSFCDEIGGIPTLALPGNCDEWETPGAIERSRAINLHNRTYEFGGFTFYGYGGSAPSFVNTIFENDEERIYADLKKIAIKKGGILCTHAPPKGHLDRTLGGYSIGSFAVLRIVEEESPLLHLFGHVHEGVGKERYQRTCLINCSAGFRGSGCYLDLDSQGVNRVTFLD